MIRKWIARIVHEETASLRSSASSSAIAISRLDADLREVSQQEQGLLSQVEDLQSDIGHFCSDYDVERAVEEGVEAALSSRETEAEIERIAREAIEEAVEEKMDDWVETRQFQDAVQEHTILQVRRMIGAPLEVMQDEVRGLRAELHVLQEMVIAPSPAQLAQRLVWKRSMELVRARRAA